MKHFSFLHETGVEAILPAAAGANLHSLGACAFFRLSSAYQAELARTGTGETARPETKETTP
jgi:hypothetical protein